MFWPGVIVSQEVAQRMGGEAIHELGTHLDQMFLGLETLFFPRAPAKGSSLKSSRCNTSSHPHIC